MLSKQKPAFFLIPYYNGNVCQTGGNFCLTWEKTCFLAGIFFVCKLEFYIYKL